MLLPRQVRALIPALIVLGLGPAPSALAETDVGMLLQERRYEEALPHLREYERRWAAKLRTSDAREHRIGWAETLHSLGMVEDRLSLWEDAISHLELARQLADEAEAGPLLLGNCYDALGDAQHHAALLEEAEASLLQAIAQRETLPDEKREPRLSASRDKLALLFLQTGRYQECGRILHETLKLAGDDDRLRAQRHGYLGKYYHALRNYAVARDHFEQAIQAADPVFGRNHPVTISLIGHLGLAHLRLAARKDGLGVAQGSEDHLKARNYLGEAVALAEKQPPTQPNAVALATHLTNLALLELLEENFGEALAAFQHGLDVLGERLGAEHPALGPLFNNLGYTHQRLGDFAAARTAFEQARSLYRTSVGELHQRTVEVDLNLAANHLLEGNEQATSLVREVTENALSVHDRLLTFGTQRQRLNYLEHVDLLSLPFSIGDDAPFLADLLLRTKARLLDSVLAEERAASELTRQLQARELERDHLVFSGGNPGRIASLAETIVNLEREIQGSAPRKETTPPNWRDVQSSLPAGGAFIDYVRYRNYRLGAEGPSAYGAILILPSGDPRWIPLGTEEELRVWLGVMKDRLDHRTARLAGEETSPPPLKLEAALQELYTLFFAPIEGMLPPGTETIGLSPDGWLNFVSFAVLLDDYQQFLATKFRTLVYLGCGRDLLLDGERPSFRDGPWDLVAIAEFEEPDDGTTGAGLGALDRAVLDTVRPFPPVPGAIDELKRIRKTLPEAARGRELKNARESDIRGLGESPTVLHLTTHGFFLPSLGKGSPLDAVQQDFNQQPELFYRAGLVTTEVKTALTRRARGEDVRLDEDGVLFMDEISSLPLQETRLVTLSSCESGLGQLAGDGVLGLRRGFTRAGADNVLLSLWPVSDRTTPRFMQQLYEVALETDRIAQPLWEMQRHHLREITPKDEEALEEAVLHYGCFVLCQRGPLRQAVDMPEIKTREGSVWWFAVAGVAGVLALVFLWPRRRVDAFEEFE